MECPHCGMETGIEPLGFGRFCPACKGFMESERPMPSVAENQLKLNLWQQKVRSIIRTKIQTEKQNGNCQ